MIVEDVLIDSNCNTWFEVEMHDSVIKFLCVSQDVPDDPITFCSGYGWDTTYVPTNTVKRIIREIPHPNQCSECNTLTLKLICDGCVQLSENLAKFETSTLNTYKYNTIDELSEILRSLHDPIINGADVPTHEYLDQLEKSGVTFGLVYFWSEYVEFNDIDFIGNVGVISGAKIIES